MVYGEGRTGFRRTVHMEAPMPDIYETVPITEPAARAAGGDLLSGGKRAGAHRDRGGEEQHAGI